MKKRQAFWILTPPLLFVVLCALIWNLWAKEKLTTYISEQLPQLIKMQNIVDLDVKSIDFSILKLQATADNIQLEFKDQLSYLEKIQIGQIKIQIDPFNLLIGQLSASYIQIESARWYLKEAAYKKIFLPDSGPAPEIILDPIFKILPDIPIQSVYLTDLQAEIAIPAHSEHSLAAARLNIKSLQVINKKTSLELNTRMTRLGAISTKNAATDFDINIAAAIEPTILRRLNIDLLKNDTEIHLQVSSKKIKTLLTDPNFEGSIKANVKLDELRNIAYVIKNDNSRLPQVSGSVKLSSSIKSQGLNKNDGQIALSYNDIVFDTLKFGSGEFKSNVKNNRFDIDNIKIEHPSGLAELKNITLENTSPYKFKTNVIVRQFSLQKLFNSLNLKDIPAEVNVQANATCEGQINSFFADCSTEISADNVSVDTDMKKTFNIVKIEKAALKAQVNLTQKDVSFKSTAQIKTSQFGANGKVTYAEGFKINFESSNLKLEDIDNIANLKLKGFTAGTLTTFGDSSHGIINADLDVDDASIDDFYLGQVSFFLDYKDALLSLTELEGLKAESQYQGNIDINLRNNTTKGDIKFSQMRVIDALSMIEEKWHLPISASGVGHAHINFNGPLDFWKLKMNIEADLSKGSLYGESFTKLNLNLTSNGEQIQFNQFRMYKPSGYIDLGHVIKTTHGPELDLTVKSKNLKADDIDHLTEYFKNISGDIQINGQVLGPLTDARIITQNQLTNFQVDNYKLPNTQLESELNKKFFHAKGQIFGRQVQADFTIPLAENEKYLVKAKFINFQPLLLLPLFSLPLPNYEVKSNFSGDIDITTEKNNFDSLFGKINIGSLALERGQQSLKLTAPAEINFKGDLANMTPVNLEGLDQNLMFKLKNHNGKNKVYSSGRVFLKPLQFLVPFTENITGIMEFVTYIQFKNGRPDFSGEGLINDASFSTKGFPYPINITSAFFDLHESKVDLTEITGSLNQTQLYGQGSADIKGPKNVQVNINVDSEELELEFPSKIFTTGFAKVNFSGNWLPYTLKIDYDVSQGLITKEFSKGADESAVIVPLNSLLPSSQTNSNSQGLLLDAKVKLNKGILIKNSIIEGVLTGNVAATGSPDMPVLTGVINIQPGSKLIFKDKPFEIQNGLVKFNGSKDINPEIAILANARVTDYDINLTVDGLAKKLDIKATSQPSLSENDIFSLLALGYTSSSTDQNISSDTQQKQTGLEVLSAIGNQSEFSKKIQSRLGLNVQLAPSVDSTRNIAVPKVIVSKKLGKKLNTSYSRSLTGDRQNNEVKLQWMFRPDTSVILNYQNQPNIQDNNIIQNQENEIGIGGFDIEYKKEFQ